MGVQTSGLFDITLRVECDMCGTVESKHRRLLSYEGGPGHKFDEVALEMADELRKEGWWGGDDPLSEWYCPECDEENKRLLQFNMRCQNCGKDDPTDGVMAHGDVTDTEAFRALWHHLRDQGWCGLPAAGGKWLCPECAEKGK